MEEREVLDLLMKALELQVRLTDRPKTVLYPDASVVRPPQASQLHQECPAPDLLTSSWNREPSLSEKVALGSSLLSLKGLMASYKKIRRPCTTKWTGFGVFGDNRSFLK